MKPLWKHQQIGLQKSLEQDNFALFFEMGTGKTATAIHTIRHLCNRHKKLLKVLILSPKAVVYNWRREFEMHSKISQNDIVILDQAGKKRVSVFLDATSHDGGKIIVTNYESMQMKDLKSVISHWQPDILICDESHRLKNHESKRAKAVVGLSAKIKYKYILSGTPILNTPMDIFNQFLVLDGGETFGKNFWAFRNQWFEDENAAWATRPQHFPKYVPRPSTFKSFNTLIYKKAMRVIKSECLDLPPLVREIATVELSPEQKKLYNQMKEDFIAFIDSELESGKSRAVVANLAVTKALRLQQIVSGFAKTEEGHIHEIKENPRLALLSEYLDEITVNHKVIIWATFHENYRSIAALCQKAQIDFSEYHGLIKNKDREENLSRFRNDPSCRVMIANPASGGVGINMTEASYSIFYSRSFSLEHDLQAEARNYRGGSEIHQKVTRIDLVAKDTIDELISQALANKQNMAEQILDWKDKL